MDIDLGSRRRRAGAAVCCLGLLATALLPVSGCSSGGATTLFPNDHRLLRSASDIAASTRPGPIPRELAKQTLEAYYLQPGDVLLLEITDLEADIRLPADQTIMPDGTIDLGEYGRIVVAGMTVEQVEAAVLSTVRSFEKDQTIKPINVRLNVAESAVCYVLGEVNSPGSYPLIGRETVLDAITTAGGLSDRASDCEIILSRPTPPPSCRVVLPVCYDRIVQLGDTTTNYQIQPGDRVFVSTRTLCEALKFWRSDCPNCADNCTRGCRTGYVPQHSPFVMREYELSPVAEPIVLPPPTVEPPMVQPPSLEPEDLTLPLPTLGATTVNPKLKNQITISPRIMSKFR